MSENPVLSAGEVVSGRFEVVRLLGVGGMAEVYEVRHQTLESRHALKVLIRTGASLRKRVHLEALAQSRLNHPNVLSVADLFEVKDRPALLLELVDGPDLDVLLSGGLLDVDEALELFAGICAGVDRAHRAGLVHRDLKPENVLLGIEDDAVVPKVADFGLVKTESAKMTRSGVSMGTPAYMSPEQIRDAASVDARTDIWSLGCILYELLTGRQPFESPDILTLYARIAAGDFAMPMRQGQPLDPHLTAAIIQCLRRDPGERFQDCRALVRALGLPWSDSVRVAHDRGTAVRATKLRESRVMVPPDQEDGSTLFLTPVPPTSQVPLEPTDVPLEAPSTETVPAKRRPWAWGLGLAAFGGVVATAALVVLAVVAGFALQPTALARVAPPHSPVVAEAPSSGHELPARVERFASVRVSQPRPAPVAPLTVREVPMSVPRPSAPPPPRSSIRISGAEAWLVNASGLKFNAEAPAGSYEIMARFDGSVVPAGSVVVQPPAAVSIRCSKELMRCMP